MTNETKPVLSEEAAIDIWQEAQARAPATFVKYLRERGLIAPAPVDELKALASEIAMGHGYRADDLAAQVALAALRRGMELAKPELTREMFDDLANDAWKANGNAWGVGYEKKLFDRLHAALQGQSK